MALYLKSLDISVVLFFSPLTALLFLSRFGLVRYIQRLGNPKLSLVSLALLSISFLILAIVPTSYTVIISGLLFGLGYSLAFPVFNVWSTEELTEAARPTAIALFNAFFHGGMFFIPWIVGVLSNIELRTHVVFLAVASCFFSVMFYRFGRNSKEQ